LILWQNTIAIAGKYRRKWFLDDPVGAERLGWEPFIETVVERTQKKFAKPTLRRYAHMDVSAGVFLSRRLHDHRALMDHPTSVLQDRTVYEDAGDMPARNLNR